jgi:hypothetical protein
MGRYILWNDVVGRYPEIAKGANALQAQVSSSFIAGAEAYVDARLTPITATPFNVNSVPDLVKDLCIDLTYVKIARRTKESKRVEDALDKTFEALINGTMQLAGSTASNAWVESEYHTSFGLDDPLNWKVDSLHLQDLEDARQ